jgi:hypothetical protein
MQADSDAVTNVPVKFNPAFDTLTLTINGTTRWGSVDGYEAYNASIHPGTDGNMTTTYVNSVAKHQRPAMIGQTAQWGCGPANQHPWCVGTDRTVATCRPVR